MNALRLWLAAALIGSVAVLAGPVNNCNAQSGCLSLSVEKASASDYSNCGNRCMWYICIDVDSSQSGCEKGGGSISHGCNGGETGDRALCPTNEVSLWSEAAKVESKSSWSYCQFVEPGGLAHFLVKDGGSCAGGTTTYSSNDGIFSENYGAIAQCAPSSSSNMNLAGGNDLFTTFPTSGCSGNGEGKECVWTVRAPTDDACDDSVTGGVDPADPPTDPPITPLPPDLTEKCVGNSSSGITQTRDETGRPLPDGALEIISSTSSSVEFRLTQLWKDSSVSWIQPVYNHQGNANYCNKEESVPQHSTRVLTATCVDGVAKMDLFVHDGSFKTEATQNIRNCPGWGNDNGIAYYSFEMSCAGHVDDCTPESPVPSPTASNPSPVPPSSPLPGPTPVVVSDPTPTTGAPTKEPGTAAPTNCDYAVFPRNVGGTPLTAGDFKINTYGTTNAEVDLTFAGTVPMVAIRYDTTVGSSTCETHTDVTADELIELTGYCYNDVAVVNVYLHNDANVARCDACDADVSASAHYYEIPCVYPDDCVTGTPTKSPSAAPSASPSASPSAGPTASPSAGPSASPSAGPTGKPSAAPSAGPSASPSSSPSASPSASPSEAPSASPSAGPSASPSSSPSSSPSASPSGSPSASPSASPTVTGSAGPTESMVPSMEPSDNPSVSQEPSSSPTGKPSVFPSAAPSATPSASPSDVPSSSPSASPSGRPSASPSKAPTQGPSDYPSMAPSKEPTPTPSYVPSAEPSVGPSVSPSASPSGSPSSGPSASPSASPSAGPSRSPSASPSTVPTPSPSDVPSATPSAEPSGTPSATPSKSMEPTSCIDANMAVLVTDDATEPISKYYGDKDLPIEIIGFGDEPDEVTFKLIQNYKGGPGDCSDSISWMAVHYDKKDVQNPSQADEVCEKTEEVCYGEIDVVYTAECKFKCDILYMLVLLPL